MVFGCLFVFVCPSVNWIVRNFQTIFVKPSSIIDYCYGKNRLHSGIDRIQNGRMTAIFDVKATIQPYFLLLLEYNMPALLLLLLDYCVAVL